MRTVIGIDPGTEKSAIVVLNDRDIAFNAVLENEEAALQLKNLITGRSVRTYSDLRVAIEFIQNMGPKHPAGREIFETCAWAGEFRRICKENGTYVAFFLRASIKSALTGMGRSADADVRRALILRYGGTKKGEPLYGINNHMRSALAVATYCADGAVLGAW